MEVVSRAKTSLTAVATAPPPRPHMAAGTIEIEMAGVRVRVRGMVDEDSRRTVLAALRASAHETQAWRLLDQVQFH